MKWYIVVRIFAVIYASDGPFESKGECLAELAMRSEQYKARYAQGERLTFMGLNVKPSNAKAECKQK